MSTHKTIHGRAVNHCHCPIVEASKFVGDFWNIWIIRSLLSKPLRFSQLQAAIPTINKTTLSHKLKELVDVALISKTLNQDQKIEYALTAKGQDLQPLLSELEKFGHKYF